MNTQKIPDKNRLKIERVGKKSEAEMFALLAGDPAYRSLSTTAACSTHAGADITASLDVIREQIERIAGGDHVDSSMAAQANTLDAIFNELARRALSAGVGVAERYLALALKAQRQCLATLKTLADNQRPQIIAQQANVLQVNNHIHSATDETHTSDAQCMKWFQGYCTKNYTKTATLRTIQRHVVPHALRKRAMLNAAISELCRQGLIKQRKEGQTTLINLLP